MSVEIVDYAGTTATTATMTIGVSEYGTIGSGTDQDWFRVNLVAGQTYEFRLLGVGNTFLSDPYVRIYDGSGTTVLGSNDDSFSSNSSTHEQDSLLVFTAATTGTFYIEADAFSTQTGGYLLTGVQQNTSGMVFTLDEIAWQLTNNGEAFFGSTEAAAFNVGIDGQLTFNVSALTAEGQTLARAALLTWSDLTGIQFVETTGVAEISFDDSDAATTAYANTVTLGTTITSSTVMITEGWLTTFGTGFNSYSYETYIHEIGHALGLGHGGNYNGSATFGADNYYLNDSLANSIMSYMPAIGDEFGTPNTFVNADFRYMLTPVLADFIAIDRLYGSSTNTRVGNTTYGYNSNTGNAQLDAAVTIGADVNFMVHDNGGIDTLDFSGTLAVQTLNLAADTLSSVLGGVFNLSISRETVIENARGGSATDTIYGNNIANSLYGNGGADVLYGLNGGDNLYGGLGADQHIGGNDAGIDYARYDDANYGNLTIRLDGGANVGAAAVGDTYNGIEGLVGGVGADTLVGNSAINYFFGGSGVDRLFGNGGADRLYGQAGNDTLLGGAGGDVLDGGGDFDYASYALAGTAVTVNMINQFLNTGEATGDNLIAIEGIIGSDVGNDVLVANNLSNAIYAGVGNDIIYGLGGGDFLVGGAGADHFRYANAGDAGDTITDFVRGSDILDFSLSGFGGGLTGGALAANRLVVGGAPVANQAFGQFLYNTTTHVLSWDVDGTGGIAAVGIVGLGTVATLSTSDFLIIA